MPPEKWLRAHAELLPASGRALDVACGRGRHALWLAERGLEVVALDRDEEAIRLIGEAAAARNLQVTAEARDLETGAVSLGTNSFDVIVAVHYLHRPLFPALIAALRPAGLLIYETFTRAQAKRGKPTNPDFLLEPGELRRLAHPLNIVAYREGEFDERDVASLVARKDAG
jgi:2-polyprenyl-3-methyl-5-hydroxy-6-metoxy-1,4-benzoquinol methylase